MIVLSRPGDALDLCRNREPAAVRVNLRRVRDQGAVADVEVVTALDASGDLVRRSLTGRDLLFLFPSPLGDPVRVRRVLTVAEHLLVQRRQSLAVEGEEVVELQRLPWLA